MLYKSGVEYLIADCFMCESFSISFLVISFVQCIRLYNVVYSRFASSNENKNLRLCVNQIIVVVAAFCLVVFTLCRLRKKP